MAACRSWRTGLRRPGCGRHGAVGTPGASSHATEMSSFHAKIGRQMGGACAATPHVCLRAALHTTHRLVLANDRVRIYAR